MNSFQNVKLCLFLFAFLSFSTKLVTSSISLNFTLVKGQTAQYFGCDTYNPTQQLFYIIYTSGGGPPFPAALETYNYNGNLEPLVSYSGFTLLDAQEVAAVLPAPNSAVPYGDWELGDIFLGQTQGGWMNPSSGQIARVIGAQTVINPWISIPSNDFYYATTQIVFDRTGEVYDGNLLFASYQSVYEVFPNATYREIISSSELTNYEGMDVVPYNTTRYGPLSGTIVIPQNSFENGGSYCISVNNIAAIAKDGTITEYSAGCHADLLYVVHEYVNFFGLDVSSGSVYAVTWDNLLSNGLHGEIIIVCEPGGSGCGGGYSGTSGLRRMYWDESSNSVQTEPIYMEGSPDGFNGWWEGGCFSRGGSSNILPGGFSFCYAVSFETMTRSNYMHAYQLSDSVLQNYYGTQSSTSSDFSFSQKGIPNASPATMTISIVQDDQNGFYLQIVNGPPSGSGSGYVDMGVTYSGPSDPNLLLRVQNDPSSSGDYYSWENYQGKFTWSWSGDSTTGTVIGPISAVLGMELFSFSFQIFSISGIDTIKVMSPKKNFTVPSDMTSFTISRISCHCGDGNPDNDPLLKKCDYNYDLSNSFCCNHFCQIDPASTICENSTSDCTLPSYCSGTNTSCPPLQTIKDCSCDPPFYGPNCTKVRCDLVTNCSGCNYYNECSWCCDGGNSQSCVPKGSCNLPYPIKCPECKHDYNCFNGTCNCGNCTCFPGYGLDNCSSIIDCTGKPVPPGQKPKSVDVCGVCGGNGTECLGCNGVPFGEQYDACGVCGGNGTECFNPCPGTDCGSCTSSHNCGWCLNDKTCYLTSYSSCVGGLTIDCSLLLSPGAIAGVSLGAAGIAGIAIGAAVFVGISSYGAKKGYDVWKNRRANIEGASTNPLYHDGGRSGVNPFHEPKGGVEMS